MMKASRRKQALNFQIFDPSHSTAQSIDHSQADPLQSIPSPEHCPKPAPTVGEKPPHELSRSTPTSELLLDLHQQALDGILKLTEATAARILSAREIR
jgi:hypothetical protein